MIMNRLLYQVEQSGNESWTVSGRGELHLSILIENMRREGFELQVSKPQVITKEIDGVMCEPFEDVLIEVPEEYVGSVIEAIGNREGEMVNMTNRENQVRLNYIVPSRGLIGFMTEFMTMTKGYGIINHTFKEYRKLAGSKVGQRKQGVLVSMENGKATAYALGQLEDRGVMFIEPGAEVYEGMIVGINSRNEDISINVCKEKHLTKAQIGHFKKNNLENFRHLQEFRVENPQDYTVGQKIDLSVLSDISKVDVTGKSIGKGFQGTVKRHNFSRGPMAHGSKYHRHAGSNGACSDPSKVFKGKRMPGQMGNKKVTIQNLEVVRVDAENNLLLVKGAVPGPKKSMITIKETVKSGK